MSTGVRVSFVAGVCLTLIAPAGALAQDPPPPAPPPVQAAPPTSGRAFNPDISVIGNFLGVAGRRGFTVEPALELTEAEVAFQSIVDPYARADFFIAVGPEGAEIEEGFITFTALPANLLLKAGKIRPQFGKNVTLHTHRQPAADVPLVVANLLGGGEGLADSGVSLAHLIPNSFVFLELTGEVFAGTSEVFASSDRTRLAYLGRARAYRDLTEATNLDFGASFAFGPTALEEEEPDGGIDAPVDSPGDAVLNRRLVGLDVTLRYRPLQRAIYRRFNLRSELVWSRQDLPTGETVSAFGVYGLAEYQFARRWFLGGRLDRSGHPFDAAHVDRGGSVFLTFWATEFSQIRGQLRRTHRADGSRGTEGLVQFNFAIGAHGAHVF